MKTIIFDLDGTLLYTLDDLKNSANYALKKCGYPLRTLDEVRTFIGNGVSILMRRCAPENISDEDHKILLNTFREHYLAHMYDYTRTYDGIDELLNTLHNQNYNLAIVSNKLDPAVKELNKKFFSGLDILAIGTPPEHKKPDAFSVVEAMNYYKANVTDSIYIGDTEVDLETAKNAGLKCVGVAWGFRNEKQLAEIEFDYLIQTPNELLTLLKNI